MSLATRLDHGEPALEVKPGRTDCFPRAEVVGNRAKMRVLLVKSRSVVSKNTGVTPPLGLMYLAAVLRAKLGADVRILDLKFCPRPVVDVVDAANELAPAFVGLSALTAEAYLAEQCAAGLKAAFPRLPVLAGGPHASAFVESTLASGNVDVAVIGEGEDTLLELAKLISAEGDGWSSEANLKKIAGIAFRPPGSDEVVRTGPRPVIEDLDSLPFPAWDLVDMPRYWKLASMATVGIRPYMTIFTSRGCPYRCTYCHNLFGKRFRGRSVEGVIDEIREIERVMGVKELEVLDDICNFDEPRLQGILEGLLRRNMHPVLSFPNAVRADLISPETIDLLQRVGAGEVSIAVETASPRLQALIRKGLDLEKVSKTIEECANRRILTRGFFMLGFPTETEEEMRSTIDFACRSPLHLALFFTVNPFPGTELYRQFVEAGKLGSSERTVDYEYYGAPFNGSEVPDARFRWLYRSAYYRFYLNPVRVARILRDRRRLNDLPARAWHVFTNLTSFRRLKESV